MIGALSFSLIIVLLRALYNFKADADSQTRYPMWGMLAFGVLGLTLAIASIAKINDTDTTVSSNLGYASFAAFAFSIAIYFFIQKLST